MGLASYQISVADQTITIAEQTFPVESRVSDSLTQAQLEELAVVFSVVPPDYLALLAQGVQRTAVFGGRYYVEEKPLTVIVDSKDAVAGSSIYQQFTESRTCSNYDLQENQIIVPDGFDINCVLYALNYALDEYLYVEDVELGRESLDPQKTRQLRLPSLAACESYSGIQEYRELSRKKETQGLSPEEEDLWLEHRNQLLALGMIRPIYCLSQSSAVAEAHFYTAAKPYEDFFAICEYQLANPAVLAARKANLRAELVAILRSGDADTRKRAREEIRQFIFHSPNLDELVQYNAYASMIWIILERPGDERKEDYDFLVSVLKDHALSFESRMRLWGLLLYWGREERDAFSRFAPNVMADLQQIVVAALQESELSEKDLRSFSGTVFDNLAARNTLDYDTEDPVELKQAWNMAKALLTDPKMPSPARQDLASNTFFNRLHAHPFHRPVIYEFFSEEYCQSEPIPLGDRIDFVNRLILATSAEEISVEGKHVATNLLIDMSHQENLPPEIKELVKGYDVLVSQ